MSRSGNQGGGGSPHMNAQRVERAAAKLSTPGIAQAQPYPLPPPVKRQALTASVVLQPVQSRMTEANRA